VEEARLILGNTGMGRIRENKGKGERNRSYVIDGNFPLVPILLL